ncbi:MAG: ABC transporter permease subunit [Gammaproteobacteria bacterium]|nr:ABC transporter permease subunit [Gammaproteobacteria bacterium]
MKITSSSQQKNTGWSWHNPTLRGWVYQIFTIITVLFLVYYLGSNMIENLRLMGLPFGFDFLTSTASFDIGWTIIDYRPDMNYWRVYLVGMSNTLILSFLIIVFATVLGFLMGVVRLSKHPLVAILARAYIEIFRNIPLLIQIIFWFVVVFLELPKPKNSFTLGESVFLNNRGLYTPELLTNSPVLMVLLLTVAVWLLYWLLPSRLKPQQSQLKSPSEPEAKSLAVLATTGIKWLGYGLMLYVVFLIFSDDFSWQNPQRGRFNIEGGLFLPAAFCAALIAMTVYRSVTIAEMVRAGILSVDQGQKNAAQAIGFTRWQTLKLILIPQSARSIIPPLINAWLTIVKESSLAVAIGFPELVSLFMQTSLNQTGRAIEVVMMVMAFYVVTSLLISGLMNQLNKRMQIKER